MTRSNDNKSDKPAPPSRNTEPTQNLKDKKAGKEQKTDKAAKAEADVDSPVIKPSTDNRDANTFGSGSGYVSGGIASNQYSPDSAFPPSGRRSGRKHQ
jgi:hypothetical protein